MRRLAPKMVREGLMIAWRLAIAPTSRFPCGVKARTEGVSRWPVRDGMTTGWPSMTAATTEFVVPRSIPMVGSWAMLSWIPSLCAPWDRVFALPLVRDGNPIGWSLPRQCAPFSLSVQEEKQGARRARRRPAPEDGTPGAIRFHRLCHLPRPPARRHRAVPPAPALEAIHLVLRGRGIEAEPGGRRDHRHGRAEGAPAKRGSQPRSAVVIPPQKRRLLLGKIFRREL